MNSTRNEWLSLIEQNRLAPQDIERAAQILEVQPSSRTWLHFLDRTFLLLGSLAISVSLVFFIAYNWLEFGHFAKFALVESAIVLATCCYVCFHKLQIPNLIGQASLMVACLSLGVLLALFGQTYQTGADPWQLFFNWALLMLPWLLLSRSSWLWLFWCTLLNISLVLWIDAYGMPSFWFGSKHLEEVWATLILNLGIITIWESSSSRFNWLNNRWAVRALTAVAIWLATILAIGPKFSSNTLTTLVMLALMFATGYFYRRFKPDLFILALLALSASVIALFYLGGAVFDSGDNWLEGFFLMGISTLALGTIITVWLKNVHKEIVSQETSS